MQNQASRLIKPAFGLSLAAFVLITLFIAMQASAGNASAPGRSTAFGKSLAQWQELYGRWLYGGVNVPTDANGNAVVGGNVVLLGLPNAPGDGTPGSLDVTLKPGQAFVLPEFGEIGTSYTDGTPPDPMLELRCWKSITHRNYDCGGSAPWCILPS
jgi:hypothetical protein